MLDNPNPANPMEAENQPDLGISVDEVVVQTVEDVSRVDIVQTFIDSVDHQTQIATESDADSDLGGDRDYCFSTSGSENEETTDEFRRQLAQFCISYLPDTGTDKLLKILQSAKVDVPKNHNDLYEKQTAKMSDPIKINGGEILYIGVKANLLLLDEKTFEHNELVVDFSWDGVRLHNSSSTKMWPIVMSIVGNHNSDVMLIAVFFGKSNPKNSNEYFYCLVKELNDIYNNNRQVEVGRKKRLMKLRVRLFISDTPARTFALCKY